MTSHWTRKITLILTLGLMLTLLGFEPVLARRDSTAGFENRAQIIPPPNEQTQRADDASPEAPSYAPGRMLVRLQPEAGRLLQRRLKSEGATMQMGVASVDALGRRYQIQQIAPLFQGEERLAAQAALGDIYQLSFPADTDIAQAAATYAADPAIAWAEPDYLAYAAETAPNDPLLPGQWGLDKIEASTAWGVITGTQPGVLPTIIAVIDSGIDLTHPDLQANLWINAGEIPGNGIDDDNNEYIDDVQGWNFVNSTNNVYDGNGHGTQVAGVAAAVTNNTLGIAGVCWNCKIMPVRVMADSGVSNYSDIALGIEYAADKGAHVINLSLGGYAYSNALLEAITYAVDKGAMIVGGAGNDNINTPFYPAAYEDVLAVAGTTVTDTKAIFSN